MNALNQVILEGNVVRQPEKRMCKTGMAMCTVSIAVNSSRKNKEGSYTEDVSFFDITVFGHTAEICSSWCSKGRRILVTGRLKQDVYIDKTGQKRSKVAIIADRIELRSLPKGAASAPSQSDAGQEASRTPLTKEQKMALMAQATAGSHASAFAQAAEAAQAIREEEYAVADF